MTTTTLLRLTTFPMDQARYPNINFKIAHTKDEILIKNKFTHIENEYHKFNCNVRNPTLAEEILVYKDKLCEKSPEIFNLIDKNIKNWTSNSQIKRKDQIVPYYNMLVDEVDVLLKMLENEIDKEYSIDGTKFKECQAEIERLLS